MRLETHQLFAELCETFLPEASSTMGLITGKPGGQEVVKHLHQTKGLSHDQNFQQIDKIAWSDLKNAYKGAWVIIHGDKGVGAIKAENNSYTSIASVGGEVDEFRNDRGGNNIDFLKGKIGGLRKFFVGKETGARKDLVRKRDALKKDTGPAQVNQETLLKKFKPLWVKAISAAQADIKGMITTMIKNDAFNKAEKKLGMLRRLNDGLMKLEAGELEDTPDWLKTAVNAAILMAASHHYPDTTGEISRSRYGSSIYSSTNSEGPAQLLKDISEGDTAKLGTILSFFKRSLISG
jgi:hypothetical protein